jgi:hypothetical protein
LGELEEPGERRLDQDIRGDHEIGVRSEHCDALLLIADALPAALGGQGLVSFGADGLSFELEAPLSALSENAR